MSDGQQQEGEVEVNRRGAGVGAGAGVGEDAPNQPPLTGVHLRESQQFTQEQKEMLAHVFAKIDSDGNGYITVDELGEALSTVGVKVAPYEVRTLVTQYDLDKNNMLHYHEFEALYTNLKSKEIASKFKGMVTRRQNIEVTRGTSAASAQDTQHSVRQEEQVAFSDWINSNLSHDQDLSHLLPVDSEGKTLYDKVQDGILLCKVINHSCPDTIDERAINKRPSPATSPGQQQSQTGTLTVYKKYENLVLALSSAQSIGCTVVNIDASDLTKGTQHLVLGLLWQIIRIGLFNQIDLQHCPGLVRLLGEDERLEDVMRLSPEQILLRWVNYHLARAGTDKRINNFTNDIKDSEAYIYLLNQIAPKDAGVTLSPLYEKDPERRAELMLQEADKMGCRAFVAPTDVVKGNYKLNIAFTANLFNTHPGLDVPDDLPDNMLEDGNMQETREERAYRNWMNSMGVQPYVNHLYSDLCDGLIIFQLYDVIRPGIVQWKRVHKKFSRLRGFMEKIENCNYVVELGRDLRFSLVGIGGQDINDGNETLTLALVWQLMRAYTLSILTQLAGSGTGKPIIEREIIKWVNDKLSACGKSSSITSFQDPTISDARVIIDLIDCIKPGSISYEQVQQCDTHEDKLANAKYAISMARKTGARIYALPDDIVEVKPKMVMTVFACLMGRDYRPDTGSTGGGGSNNSDSDTMTTPLTGDMMVTADGNMT